MLDLYKRMFRLNPRIVAHDLHPDYLSTRYARGRKKAEPDLVLVPVQHHHAHIAGCMAENAIAPPVLGVAFDGTGLGTDGTLWGGEFFVVADYPEIRRAGHLECVPLPGGEAAIRNPYRMALSYLFTLLGEEVLAERPAFLRDVSEGEIRLLTQQIRKRIHSPLTSGAGRLFDAVSALIGVRGKIDYEAQAAVELERLCDDVGGPGDGYPFHVREEDGEWIVHLADLFSAILEDLGRGVPRGRISSRFHLTVALMIVSVCEILSHSTGLRRVVASGGVFQNRMISGLTRRLLEEKGMEFIGHREVPCNDACISLGQAVIAHFVTNRTGRGQTHHG
jgi:hydrogenase maturation protein HypF